MTGLVIQRSDLSEKNSLFMSGFCISFTLKSDIRCWLISTPFETLDSLAGGLSHEQHTGRLLILKSDYM